MFFRELFEESKFKEFGENMKQGSCKPKLKAHPQCVFISRNFHAGYLQSQVECHILKLSPQSCHQHVDVVVFTVMF